MSIGCAAAGGHIDMGGLALPPDAMEMFGSLLPLRAMSGSVVLLKLGCVLLSVVRATTKCHPGDWDGCCGTHYH